MHNRPLKYLSILLYCIWCFGHGLYSQNKKIDSLVAIIKLAKEDTNKVNQLNRLSENYRKAGNFEDGLNVAGKSLQLAEQLQFKNGIAEARSALGNGYLETSDYLKALENYTISLEIFKSTGNQKRTAALYNNIGRIYQNQGDYSKSLDYFFSSLKIRNTIGDKKGLASSYSNIGNLYIAQENYEKALENHLLALKLNSETGDKFGLCSSYLNIGTIYFSTYKIPKALEYFLLSLELSKEIGYTANESNLYQNIGSVYVTQKDNAKALHYFEESIRIRKEIGDKKGVAASLACVANVYVIQNKISEAKKTLLESNEIAREIGQKDNLIYNYERLAEIDSINGDFKSAFMNFKLFKSYSDSSYNEESLEKTTRMAAQYESEKKDNEIKLLNKDKEKQLAITEAERNKQKIIIWSVIFGAFLVIVFSLFIFRRWKITQKQKIIIEEQKRLVEEKQKEILDSIRYAKRIQQSLLPTENYLRKHIPKH